MKKSLIATAILLMLSTVPFGINAEAADKQLTFAWEQTADDLAVLDHWTLYKSEDGAAAWPWVKVGDVPYTGTPEDEYTAPFTITVPNNAETSLFFKMIAVDTEGLESDPSEAAIPAPIVIDFLAPKAPVALASYSSQTKTVTITWTQDAGDTDVVAHRVHKSAASGGPWEDLGNQTTPFAYQVQPSDSGKWMYFVVVAHDDDGNFSPSSNELAVKLVMGVPFNLKVTVSSE
jgi:hypothetical protein